MRMKLKSCIILLMIDMISNKINYFWFFESEKLYKEQKDNALKHSAGG